MWEGTIEVARAGDVGPARARRAAGPTPDAARVALRGRLAPSLAEAGFDLEDVTVVRAGSRSVVRVVVDRDSGVDLDAVADASRLVSELLDADEPAAPGTPTGALAGPYVLEVTSPGVDRPLTEPRHWRRSVGRLVRVHRADGDVVEGRVLSADADGADLAVPTGPPRRGRPVRRRVARIPYADVTRATVQVEFSSAADEPDLLERADSDTTSSEAMPAGTAPVDTRPVDTGDHVGEDYVGADQAGRSTGTSTGKEKNR